MCIVYGYYVVSNGWVGCVQCRTVLVSMPTCIDGGLLMDILAGVFMCFVVGTAVGLSVFIPLFRDLNAKK